jgi:hypothetical protein
LSFLKHNVRADSLIKKGNQFAENKRFRGPQAMLGLGALGKLLTRLLNGIAHSMHAS